MAKQSASTEKKQKQKGKSKRQAAHLEKHGFKPGQSGNPNGRPKGSRNKFSEAFLKDFMAEWERSGQDALKKVAQDDPAAFLRVAASILPKEFNINEGESSWDQFIESQTTEELHELLAGFRAVGRRTQDTEGAEQTSTKH